MDTVTFATLSLNQRKQGNKRPTVCEPSSGGGSLSGLDDPQEPGHVVVHVLVFGHARGLAHVLGRGPDHIQDLVIDLGR
eukprot:4978459-Amphidinium_carterae.1